MSNLRENARDHYYSIRYRLLGRCWAQGCGRLMVFHGPWRLARCWADNQPSAIVLPDADPIVLPDADPVVPVSQATSA